MTNPHNIAEGTTLAIPVRSYISHRPQVSHELWTVARVTATQAIATGPVGAPGRGREIRVRLSDLKLVGKDYERAVVADANLLARHDAQVKMQERFYAAVVATSDLIGKELHQLELSTEQLERLAAAWAEVKAMRSTT